MDRIPRGQTKLIGWNKYTRQKTLFAGLQIWKWFPGFSRLILNDDKVFWIKDEANIPASRVSSPISSSIFLSQTWNQSKLVVTG
jgi:hypothetical protein